MGYKAAVLGASGYAGLELLRLLAAHPGIEVVAAAASKSAGRPVTDLLPHAPGYAGMTFTSIGEALDSGAEIVFSSLPHGRSMEIFGEAEGARVVDLAGDFRLKDARDYEEWYGAPHSHPEALEAWTYGLTELHHKQIEGAGRVANPGCYPAAALLALAPLLAAGAVEPAGIRIDAKSGVSGAGRASGEGFAFAEAAENTRPYSVTGHKHVPEIEQELSAQAGEEVRVTFIPHIVPMVRGIVATCTARLKAGRGTAELAGIMTERYEGEPFVRVLDEKALPETKRLAGTNLAEVTVRADERTGTAIAIAAIDNLGKGAAGQAVQNANLMLGFEETTALESMGMVP